MGIGYLPANLHYLCWVFCSTKLRTNFSLFHKKIGSNLNLKDIDGCTPLHWASGNSNMEVVRCLVEAHADVNLKDDDGYTPLHCASHNGHLKVVRCLVEAHADVYLKDNDGRTPLHWASMKGHEQVVRLLTNVSSK